VPFAITALCVRQFLHGSICLIDGLVRIGIGAGIGVGDGNSAERFAADDPGLFFFLPIGIEQRIRRERVAMPSGSR
jgi:hypothetical protein